MEAEESMEEVKYTGLRNGGEGCELLQDCMEDAGITWIIHGSGTAEELVSSLAQFAWFHSFVPLQGGIAFMPTGGDDQVVMGMVSTPSGVAAILPVFNNPSAEQLMDEFVEDVMSLQPRWTAGFSTLGATMRSTWAGFLSEPRLVDLGPHLDALSRQELPHATLQQLIAFGWELSDSGLLLKGVLPARDGRTQLVFVQNGPAAVLALSPVGEPFDDLPTWATNQDWGNRGWKLIGSRLYMTERLDTGPSCTVEYARQMLSNLAADADHVESQLSQEDLL